MEIVGGWIPEGGVFFVFCLLLLEHPVYCFWRFGSERREPFFSFFRVFAEVWWCAVLVLWTMKLSEYWGGYGCDLDLILFLFYVVVWCFHLSWSERCLCLLFLCGEKKKAVNIPLIVESQDHTRHTSSFHYPNLHQDLPASFTISHNFFFSKAERILAVTLAQKPGLLHMYRTSTGHTCSRQADRDMDPT